MSLLRMNLFIEFYTHSFLLHFESVGFSNNCSTFVLDLTCQKQVAHLFWHLIDIFQCHRNILSCQEYHCAAPSSGLFDSHGFPISNKDGPLSVVFDFFETFQTVC